MPSVKIPILSKSKYLAGLQCPLRLWHQCYNQHLASAVSVTQQALFEAGRGGTDVRERGRCFSME